MPVIRTGTPPGEVCGARSVTTVHVQVLPGGRPGARAAGQEALPSGRCDRACLLRRGDEGTRLLCRTREGTLTAVAAGCEGPLLLLLRGRKRTLRLLLLRGDERTRPVPLRRSDELARLLVAGMAGANAALPGRERTLLLLLLRSSERARPVGKAYTCGLPAFPTKPCGRSCQPDGGATGWRTWPPKLNARCS